MIDPRLSRPIRRLVLAATALALAGQGVPGQAARPQAVPYWASLHWNTKRTDMANMREGPGDEYPVRRIYRRLDLPVKVVRVTEGWVRVQDPGGEQGWFINNFVSKARTAMVTGRGAVDMREKPDAASRLLWRLSPGLVGRLGDCREGWCRLDIDGRAGFVPAERLWGAGAP